MNHRIFMTLKLIATGYSTGDVFREFSSYVYMNPFELSSLDITIKPLQLNQGKAGRYTIHTILRFYVEDMSQEDAFNEATKYIYSSPFETFTITQSIVTCDDDSEDDDSEDDDSEDKIPF